EVTREGTGVGWANESAGTSQATAEIPSSTRIVRRIMPRNVVRCGDGDKQDGWCEGPTFVSLDDLAFPAPTLRLLSLCLAHRRPATRAGHGSAGIQPSPKRHLIGGGTVLDGALQDAL